MCGPDMVGPVCSPKKIEKPSQPGKRKAALPSFPPWDCIVFENSCTENCEGTPGIRVEMRESRGGWGCVLGSFHTEVVRQSSQHKTWRQIFICKLAEEGGLKTACSVRGEVYQQESGMEGLPVTAVLLYKHFLNIYV